MRGATHYHCFANYYKIISIHTPHAGSDSMEMTVKKFSGTFQSTLPMRGATHLLIDLNAAQLFQSTLPMRGATKFCQLLQSGKYISIHTPHAGSDKYSCILFSESPNFNPHSPCGERLKADTREKAGRDFNPHSPCGERRKKPGIRKTMPLYFNPHSPCGERPPSAR